MGEGCCQSMKLLWFRFISQDSICQHNLQNSGMYYPGPPPPIGGSRLKMMQKEEGGELLPTHKTALVQVDTLLLSWMILTNIYFQLFLSCWCRLPLTRWMAWLALSTLLRFENFHLDQWTKSTKQWPDLLKVRPIREGEPWYTCRLCETQFRCSQRQRQRMDTKSVNSHFSTLRTTAGDEVSNQRKVLRHLRMISHKLNFLQTHFPKVKLTWQG